MHARPAAGRAPRIVKRYRNRKFYDTLECRYVRLEELAEVIARGSDVRVVEHDGDRDITQATLFALLGLRERQAPSLEPAVLHDLVRGVLAAPAEGAAPGGTAAPVSDPSSAQRLAELRARGEKLRVEAEASWAASRAQAEALRAAIQAQAGAAWGAVGSLGKVNRELRRLRAEIDDLVAQLDPSAPRASTGG
ncbi:MAG: hypothetical protein HZB56_06285 [Deltaproteobacteria bacterium]|nr:hypothetical protein [Deltaproteobacteria bacterium]